jgi:hypothetical protein
VPWCFPRIERLNVNSILLDKIQDSQRATERFLNAFPGLRHLSIRFKANRTFYGLDDLSDWPFQDALLQHSLWPYLQTLYIDWLCISEDKLFGIIQRHCETLQTVVFGHISLTSGSWNSFFVRIEMLEGNTNVQIERWGMLWDQTSIYIG